MFSVIQAVVLSPTICVSHKEKLYNVTRLDFRLGLDETCEDTTCHDPSVSSFGSAISLPLSSLIVCPGKGFLLYVAIPRVDEYRDEKGTLL